MSNTWIYKYIPHTTLRLNISTPKCYLMSILEGLAIIYKICKMPELLGSNSNSRTGNKWGRLKMLHPMKINPPMDLPSERLILTLKISPSNNHFNPSLQIPPKNNTVTKGYCAVGARKSVGQVPRSVICSKGFQTDLSKKREPPPCWLL